MIIKLTKHAGIRIIERVNFNNALQVIVSIFKNENYIPIGYDFKKSHVQHCLFYIKELNEFFIACIDENNNEVITILFGYEFRGWEISTETYNEVKLKSINQSLELNLEQKFSYIELNLMKKSSKEYTFIQQYLYKNNLIKNKNQKKLKNYSSKNLIAEKKKSLLEENLKKMKSYQITKEDKKIIEDHNKKYNDYINDIEFKKNKVLEDYSKSLSNLGLRLISNKEDYFICEFSQEYKNSFINKNIDNLFLSFNKNLQFKIHRYKKININKIRYYVSKNEVEILATYYLKLCDKNNYKEKISYFLKETGFEFFDNQELIQRIKFKINKIKKN